MTTAAALLTPAWPVTKTKEQVLQEWLDASAALTKAKDIEMSLRKLAIEQFPELATKDEGTVYAPLANDWKIKAVKKKNYNLAASGTDTALTAYEKSAGSPEEYGRRQLETEKLVKWKPELSISEYRAASDELKAAIADVLTITDGAPSLELIDPTKKKK